MEISQNFVAFSEYMNFNPIGGDKIGWPDKKQPVHNNVWLKLQMKFLTCFVKAVAGVAFLAFLVQVTVVLASA